MLVEWRLAPWQSAVTVGVQLVADRVHPGAPVHRWSPWQLKLQLTTRPSDRDRTQISPHHRAGWGLGWARDLVVERAKKSLSGGELLAKDMA